MLDLYDAVGHGMWAYSNAAFRVDVLDRERFEPAPGTLVAVTHRRETDVPVICPPLYFAMGGTRRKTGRLHFAARDDMFLPGFFAGFPPELPLRARRVLYKVGVARWLPAVNVFPIRSATVARVGEVIAARRGAALDDLLAEGRVSDLRERAARCGLPRPARAEDVLRGEYADLLWQPISPEDGGGLEDFWAGRAAQAAGDFRTLVQIARDGNVLVVFPEGRPSPDGEIGPIRPGIGALVRRGRPTADPPPGDRLRSARPRPAAGAPRARRSRRAAEGRRRGRPARASAPDDAAHVRSVRVARSSRPARRRTRSRSSATWPTRWRWHVRRAGPWSPT